MTISDFARSISRLLICLWLLCILLLESNCRRTPNAAELREKPAPNVIVLVTLVPDGYSFADIYMDGKIVASASSHSAARLTIPSGVHVFKAALDGYGAVEKEVQVLDEGEQQINFRLVWKNGA